MPYSLIDKLQESGINAADLKKLKEIVIAVAATSTKEIHTSHKYIYIIIHIHMHFIALLYYLCA